MPWLAAAATVGGALIGSSQAQAQRDAANSARQAALEQYANLQLPSLEQQQLNLQDYNNAGTLTPEQEQSMQMGPTAMEGISLDPQTRAMQMQALEQMSGMASGQVQPGDIAGFEIAKRDAAAQDQAKQGQILQEMQQRGQGGSGAELLARLKSSQSSADRLNQADLEQAKQMQQARIAALQSQSNMASGLRNQDYGEQSDLAKARDAIAQFNTQNSQNVEGRNVAAKNSAQSSNLQNAQNLGNMNVENQNKQQISNKGLLQQQFNNQMGLANARAGQYGQQANSQDTQAGQTAGMWAGIGQGVGTAVSAYGNNKNKTNTQG